MNMLLTRHRIRIHKRNSLDAQAQQDRARFWKERRLMLLAQAELLELMEQVKGKEQR